MAGYTFSITEDLIVYPSYTHFEYSKNNYALQSVFSDVVQTDIYLDKKHYFGGITASYFFGKKQMFYASIQNAIGFEKNDFVFKNSYLNIQLEFDINISDRNYYNEFIYEEWNAEEFLSWIEEYYPTSEREIIARIYFNGFEPTKSVFFDRLNEYNPDFFKPDYGISSVNFMLPIYYTVGSFMFNLTSYLIIPTYNSMFYEQDPMFIFNAGVSYILSF